MRLFECSEMDAHREQLDLCAAEQRLSNYRVVFIPRLPLVGGHSRTHSPTHLSHYREVKNVNCLHIESGIEEPAAFIEPRPELNGDSPYVSFRIAKAEAVTPSRARGLRVEVANVIESGDLSMRVVDRLLVFDVDSQRDTATCVPGRPETRLEVRLGDEAQHDAVGTLKDDVLGRARRRFQPAKLAIEGGHRPRSRHESVTALTRPGKATTAILGAHWPNSAFCR